MRPAEILDSQIELLRKLDEEKVFRDQIAFLFAHHAGEVVVSEKLDVYRQEAKNHEAAIKKYGHISNVLRNDVQVASAYRVTHDMSKMVEWMATQLEDDDKFFRQLLPTEAGLVCFERPLHVKDIRGKTMMIHWLIWGPAEGGTMFWTFNDMYRGPDEVNQHFKELAEEDMPGAWDNYLRITGRWSTIGVSVLGNGIRMGPPEWTPSIKQRMQVFEEGIIPTNGTNILRLFQSLIMLLNQTIVQVVAEDVERPARRRAAKHGIPPRVSVIRLRRNDSDGKSFDETQVEWQHRWIVRRHWRWQPYGRRNGCQHVYGEVEPHDGTLARFCVNCDNYVLRITIDPYVKGPEGAPLVQTEKVYSLER